MYFQFQILTLANHFWASGISECDPTSVKSLTMSGKRDINSLFSSCEAAWPVLAGGKFAEAAVEYWLNLQQTHSIISFIYSITYPCPVC